MDEQRIIDELQSISEKQSSQNETLIRLTVSVEEHVRRSNLLEEAQASQATRVASLETLVNKGKGAFWLLTSFAAALAFFKKFF